MNTNGDFHLAWANEKIERIKNSRDKRILYRDMRPIRDLRHMFFSSAELYSERPAFYVKKTQGEPYTPITYGQAKRDVESLGTALISMGLAGKRIAIMGENCYEWAISYLSVVGGVGVVVPLDKELPEQELLYLVTEAEVECVVCSPKFQSVFERIKKSGQTKIFTLITMDALHAEGGALSMQSVLEIGQRLIENGDRTFLDLTIEDPEAMSILLYTSGTTGLAKAVMLSHKNIVADLMAQVALVHIVKEDVFFSVLPIHHTYECTSGFLCPLYRGAAIAYCQGLRYILKNLSEVRPTVFLVVPLILENLYSKIWKIAKKSKADGKLRMILRINRYTQKIKLDLAPLLLKKITAVFGGRLRLLICGGAPIDPAVLQGISALGIRCLQGYGLTECSPIAALNPDVSGKAEAAGYRLPDITFKTIEEDSHGIGEICVRGENVMLGYYNRPEETAQVIKDGWYHTGDLGYVDADGFLHITGRKKNVIITKNGKNVFPEELEYYLNRIDYIRECMVFGTDSGDAGADTLIAAAVLGDEEALSTALGEAYTKEEALGLIWKEIDKLNAGLPYFKRIKKIGLRTIDFERTTAKKIRRFVPENQRL